MRLSPSLSRWLLGSASDPSVRWRTLVEVLGHSPADRRVLRTRRQIGKTGWAAGILTEQLNDGQWTSSETSAGDLYRPKYIATNWRMIVLADLGLTRRDPRIRRMIDLVVRRWGGPRGALGGRESEVCITGNALRAFLKLGYTDHPEVKRMINWIVDVQKNDGGWHCFPSRSGTLDGWEGLAAFAFLPKSMRGPSIERAIERGVEFYLERRLAREGADRYAPWYRIHYPNHYYYDLLVGLDMITRLGYGSDPRLRPALRWLLDRRDSGGRWALDADHPDLPSNEQYRLKTPYYSFVLERPGAPSRWATVSALAVLARVPRLS